MKTKKIVSLGLAGLTGVALGEVYIVDPSIDQYKQKTDQAFYDLYQNTRNIVSKGIRKENEGVVHKFDSVSTDQRLADTTLNMLPIFTDYIPDQEGTYIRGVKSGGTRKGCWIRDFGSTGMLLVNSFVINEDGTPSSGDVIYASATRDLREVGIRRKFRHGGHFHGEAEAGWFGIKTAVSDIRCVQYCGGGCVVQERDIEKLMLDKACRIGALYKTVERRYRSCWACGKSTCYGAWSRWYEASGGEILDQISLTQSYGKGARIRGRAW